MEWRCRVFITSGLILPILPGCFNRQSITIKKDDARLVYDDVLGRYEHELELLRNLRGANFELQQNLGKDLHDEILLKHEEYNQQARSRWLKFGKNEYENYPYTNYRIHLDQDIKSLEQAGSKVYWKNEGLGRSIQDLVRELDGLRRYLVLHKEYGLERRLMEKKLILAMTEKKELATKSNQRKPQNKK